MILDIIYILGIIFLTVIRSIFSLVSFVIPDQVEESINTAIGYSNYFNGIFPMNTFWTVITVFLSFTIAIYSVKAILWLAKALRLVGGNVDIKH